MGKLGNFGHNLQLWCLCAVSWHWLPVQSSCPLPVWLFLGTQLSFPIRQVCDDKNFLLIGTCFIPILICMVHKFSCLGMKGINSTFPVEFKHKVVTKTVFLFLQILSRFCLIQIFTLPPGSLFSFGMIHDGEGNACRKAEGNIMSPTLTGNNGVFSWSVCSRQYLNKFLRQVRCKSGPVPGNAALVTGLEFLNSIKITKV